MPPSLACCWEGDRVETESWFPPTFHLSTRTGCVSRLLFLVLGPAVELTDSASLCWPFDRNRGLWGLNSQERSERCRHHIFERKVYNSFPIGWHQSAVVPVSPIGNKGGGSSSEDQEQPGAVPGLEQGPS